MTLIKGIPVTLYVRKKCGVDAMNAPVYTETPVTVENVLVTPLPADVIRSEIQLSGRRVVYELSIPKADYHDWADCRVDFFGQSWHVCGAPQTWIPDLVPGDWNTKWKVERYE